MRYTGGVVGRHANYSWPRTAYPEIRFPGGVAVFAKSAAIVSRQYIRRNVPEVNQPRTIWRRIHCENRIVVYEFFAGFANVVQYAPGVRRGLLLIGGVDVLQVTGLDAIPRGTRRPA